MVQQKQKSLKFEVEVTRLLGNSFWNGKTQKQKTSFHRQITALKKTITDLEKLKNVVVRLKRSLKVEENRTRTLFCIFKKLQRGILIKSYDSFLECLQPQIVKNQNATFSQMKTISVSDNFSDSSTMDEVVNIFSPPFFLSFSFFLSFFKF